MVHLSKVTKDAEADNLTLKKLHINDAIHNEFTTSVYGSRFAAQDLPKLEMPEQEMPREVAYRLIHLDGNPILKYDAYVLESAGHGHLLLTVEPVWRALLRRTCPQEDEAEKLMLEAMPKNFIDYEEYPQTADIQNRCISMIGRLFNAPLDEDSQHAVGTSCVGSSEAIILGTLAMKKRWQNKRRAAGKPCDRPNIVMSSAVQVCWEKAARYLDVEERFIYCTEDRFVIDPEETVKAVDENTIGICVILGVTYTGEYEDVKAVNDLLVKNNIDCGIHVDAASGGFVAPFLTPELEWDFRLEKVISINVSGHKYGLVYPGIGWVLWRSPEYLPKELVFNINYLGADQASFTLNFSKGASPIIGQYYQLIRLGKRGYRAIMVNLRATADYLAVALKELGFIILSKGDGHGLPLVAFRLNPEHKHHYDEFAIAHQLRERGWIVPAYTMAPHAQNMKLMRVVVREDFSQSRCDQLIVDIKVASEILGKMDKKSLDEHLQRVKDTAAARKRIHHHPHYKHEKHSLQGKTGKTHAVC